MWAPTENDVVEMFARHFQALHKIGAENKARERAAELQNGRDAEGHHMWKRVADRIAALRHHEAKAYAA